MKHFVIAALLMTGVAAFAQTEVKSEPVAVDKVVLERFTPEGRTKQLTEQLTLTAKQQEKVKALYEEDAKLKTELREQRKAATDDATKEQLKEKAKKDKEAFNVKMKGILTAEQYTQWEAIKSKKALPADKGQNQPRIKNRSAVIKQ